MLYAQKGSPGIANQRTTPFDEDNPRLRLERTALFEIKAKKLKYL